MQPNYKKHLEFGPPPRLHLPSLSLTNTNSPICTNLPGNLPCIALHCTALHCTDREKKKMMLHALLLLLPSLLLHLHITSVAAAPPSELRPGFYSESCPEAESTIRDVIKKAMIREPRSGASVMRLQFHDCFVNGCDGSVLLDDTPAMLGEKLALSNINSLRSFEVIDEAKEALERICPQTVSCADLVIIAARDAVALSGGPDWEVKLGRKDSLTASQQDSDNIMPSPRANASYLIDLFHRFNLSVKDLVALSGSHSIGEGRCFSIVFRLYNQSGSGKPDPEMDPSYREKLDKLCPITGDQNVTGDLDATPTIFDNQYFKDLVLRRGFLNSDQTLHTFKSTREWVVKFSEEQDEFFDAFVEGMLKLGDLQSGRPGEIRTNCRVVNGQPPHGHAHHHPMDLLLAY
ncbi:Peroxidase 17 [Dionaea muscipula]